MYNKHILYYLFLFKFSLLVEKGTSNAYISLPIDYVKIKKKT